MRGAIAWMANNSVAANLLMVLIVLIGFVALFSVPQEVFPESSLDAIRIQIEYPGATPEDVEQAIVTRIEEQIEGVEGIRRLTSIAAENVGIVTAELKLGTDVSRALDDIKSEIDRITTFPMEAEEPTVQELTNRRQVIQLAVHGDADERSIKEFANRIKDDLTALDEISFVKITGVRDYEISIEVPESTLRAYGLRLSDVAMAVRRGSLDLAGGSIETRNEEILVRTEGERYSGRDFEEIVVLARSDGTQVRLGDIARVIDGFEQTDLLNRFDGRSAAFVEVYRTGDERVLEIVDRVYEYLEAISPSLPTGISVDVWQDEAKLLKSRFDLMVRNGRAGLILVIIALTLFLNIRLSLWVSLGIFISFMGAFAVMTVLDVSINLISLFAFILSLGIVVDDAIVVGENIFAEKERGVPGVKAAAKGAIRLARPVTFAVLTTIAAFSPLLFVPGVMGKFMRNIPIIVIAVLLFSLIESLFVLPAHLSHGSPADDARRGGLWRWIRRMQDAVTRGLQWNIDGPVEKSLSFATKHYVIVLVSGVTLVLLSAGLVAGGVLRFSFFPDIEGENVYARLEMPQGTPAEQTRQFATMLEARGREVIDEIQRELPAKHPPLLKHILVSVGQQPSVDRAPNAGMNVTLSRSNVAEVNLELLEAEDREVSAERIERLWREKVGELPNAKSLVFQSAIFSLGKPIQLELSASSTQVLERAVEAVKEELGRYAGVSEIEDDEDLGKREVKLQLKPRARTLGVTLDDLARQVRAAFFGEEARRIQRGRDDIRVMVRLPEDERNSLADIKRYRIRTPAGSEIPLEEVASLSLGYGPSAIQRRDRRRVTTITAEVDEETVSAQEIVNSLETDFLPGLVANFPGVRASFEGEQRERADALAALARGFIIALFVIYALLAIPFKSYVQPFIIMAAIPFGVIGAILGHAVMGLTVGLVSLFGIVGLSGVVVNDSLVLIDFINEEVSRGTPVREAIIRAGKVRFRPIVLTSLTTFLGVLPLILEKSLQAQFLIPMAASLGFGVLFATVIIIVLVPALVMIQHRLGELVGRLRRGRSGAEMESVPTPAAFSVAD